MASGLSARGVLEENVSMAARKKVEAGPPEKVFKAGLPRDPEKFVYYVEKNGDVVRMERGVARARTEVVLRTGMRREKGYMYYVDDEGDVAREPDSD